MRDDLRILGVLLISLAITGGTAFISLSLSDTLRLTALDPRGVVFSNARRYFCPYRRGCITGIYVLKIYSYDSIRGTTKGWVSGTLS